ncbi:universal stress protein [Polaromonas sp.]|uniref:universal stress protein n=1 Tax=Polaromonas sp. TaxID=1869339 RepID=UPI001E037959|nr:universal stress protein [Polaromonas sp.]MBT9475180.1 universal stress protein [Polaromonas sp.]
MYKNLLVPLDGTSLSASNTTQAVQLAKALGARISFFHAIPNFGATDEGALWRHLDTSVFTEQSVGDSRAILAKAAADAAAQGVACSLHAEVADRPAEAIMDAVKTLGCDLIVMASRGERGMRGWLHGSQTERVLRATHTPLLITRVQTNEPLSNAEQAIGLIRDEHRSMAVVINGMRDLARLARESGNTPDIASLQRMLQYVHDFPEKLHHPKEEQHLHVRLLQRHPQSRKIIDELEAQHQAEYAGIGRVSHAIDDCAAQRSGALERLIDELNAYAEAAWAHMGLEESTLLPLARQHLLAEDWREIAQAFQDNNDPRFGELSGEAFRRLFTRITHLLPNKPTGN